MTNYATFSIITAARRRSALLLVALAAAACASSDGKNTSGGESTGTTESDSETVGEKPPEMPGPTTGTDSDSTVPDDCSSGCGLDSVCSVESDVLPNELPCEAGAHCEKYENECGCEIRSCVPNCTADSCPEGQVCDAGSGKCAVEENPDQCSSGCGDMIECQPEGSEDSTGGEPSCEPGFHCSVDLYCGCTLALCQPDCDPTNPASCPEGKVCDEQTKSCKS